MSEQSEQEKRGGRRKAWEKKAWTWVCHCDLVVWVYWLMKKGKGTQLYFKSWSTPQGEKRLVPSRAPSDPTLLYLHLLWKLFGLCTTTHDVSRIWLFSLLTVPPSLLFFGPNSILSAFFPFDCVWMCVKIDKFGREILGKQWNKSLNNSKNTHIK